MVSCHILKCWDLTLFLQVSMEAPSWLGERVELGRSEEEEEEEEGTIRVDDDEEDLMEPEPEQETLATTESAMAVDTEPLLVEFPPAEGGAEEPSGAKKRKPQKTTKLQV